MRDNAGLIGARAFAAESLKSLTTMGADSNGFDLISHLQAAGVRAARDMVALQRNDSKLQKDVDKSERTVRNQQAEILRLKAENAALRSAGDQP